MNWRRRFPDRDTALREFEDFKITCNHEWLKIGFGLLFIIISAVSLFILVTPPPTNSNWGLFALVFSLLFGLLMFGLNLTITGLTSNAAKNKRFQDEVNNKLTQLRQERVSNPQPTPVGITECDMDPDFLKEIRDNSKGIFYYLKNSGNENRELTYSSLILSYVAAIVALIVLGNDIWSAAGLPLLLLWTGTLFLLIGGPFWIYWGFKKNTFALVVGIVCLIGVVIVLIIGLFVVLNGIHAPTPPTTGNITNIWENGSYTVTNVINNYNVTITGNCTSSKNSLVSIEEMKYLMRSHPT